MCAREIEFKSILFSLCYFHAVVSERRKFGPQGWNRVYPFNNGDLTISVSVLYNYLEANTRVPWEDLRYLFGEIMYGGHITDDWDRRLCKTYLEEYMNISLVSRLAIFVLLLVSQWMQFIALLLSNFVILCVWNLQ
jgi:dynein heavy chain, axonemal